MLRLLIDENLDHRIVRGLKLRLPGIDLILTQNTEFRGKEDPLLLAWAAAQNRILVTHDLKTVPRYAYKRVEAGEPMPGVVAVADALPLGRAIDDLALLVELSSEQEMWSLVVFLPI